MSEESLQHHDLDHESNFNFRQTKTDFGVKQYFTNIVLQFVQMF